MANLPKVTERWIKTKESPDYLISTWGRVKNKKTGKFLVQSVHKGNSGKPSSLRVYLRINNKQIKLRVHRLMIPFLGMQPSPQHYTIDHINRNPLDNCITNLRWATMKEQSRNKNRRWKKIVTTKKLTMRDLDIIYKRTKIDTLPVVGKDYGISQSELSTLLRFMHPKY